MILLGEEDTQRAVGAEQESFEAAFVDYSFYTKLLPSISGKCARSPVYHLIPCIPFDPIWERTTGPDLLNKLLSPQELHGRVEIWTQPSQALAKHAKQDTPLPLASIAFAIVEDNYQKDSFTPLTFLMCSRNSGDERHSWGVENFLQLYWKRGKRSGSKSKSLKDINPTIIWPPYKSGRHPIPSLFPILMEHLSSWGGPRKQASHRTRLMSGEERMYSSSLVQPPLMPPPLPSGKQTRYNRGQGVVLN